MLMQYLFIAIPYVIQLELVLIVIAVVLALLPSMRERSVSLVLVALSSCIGLIGGAFYIVAGNAEAIYLFAPKELPWATLQIEMLSVIFFMLINAVTLVSAWFGARYSTHLVGKVAMGSMHAQTAVFVLGMLGTVLSTTPLMFLICWELMSVASFLLVISERSTASIRAGLFYFVMTQLGAIAIAIGFAIVSSGDMLHAFTHFRPSGEWQLLVAFLLFLVGFGGKAGLVPLHAWLPLAHPEAPSHISALMSGAMLKVAVYGFVMVYIKVLGPIPSSFGVIVVVLGLVTALYGVVNAIVEHDIKTVLAWSSIENIGLIFTLIGVSIYAAERGPSWLAPAALILAFFMALNHALFKSGLFMSAGVIAHSVHTRNMNAMGGLANRMPLFSKGVLLLALAAAALPPAGAFFAEFAFLRSLFLSFSAVELLDKLFYLVIFAAVALVGGLAIFAMTRFFAIIFLGQPRTESAEKCAPPHTEGETLPVLIAGFATLAFGLFAPWVFALLLGESTNVFGTPTGLSSFLSYQFFPIALFVVVLFAVAFFIHRLLVRPQVTRSVQTWDCGQPINARMEYTGTGFAAPMRFFFLFILRSKKVITRTPIVDTNSILRTAHVEFTQHNLFSQFFYDPIIHLIHYVRSLARKLHSGDISGYLTVMFATIIILLIVGLWN